jgi:phosphopantetheinyl transferase
VWAWTDVDERGARDAGQRAAQIALGGLELAHEGPRPIVRGRPDLAISISHSAGRAVAVVGSYARLGIDICAHDRGPQIRGLAPRFLSAHERTLAASDRSAAAVWTAKEAGLKALGLGLLDGMSDGCPVEVASIDPPRFASPAELVLEVEHEGDLAIAVAYTAPSTTTVAPFM